MAEEYLIVDTLYDAVFEGKWTYDMYDKMASSMYVDKNNNNAVDEGDIFGITHTEDKNAWVDALIAGGCADAIVIRDENNLLEYSYSERCIDILMMIYKLNNAKPYVYLSSGYGTYLNGTTSLFSQSNFTTLDTYYRELDYDLMILPIPKYEESQETYTCRTYDAHFTMVSTTTEKLEQCGALPEILSCETYNDLIPAFIEGTLELKLASDPESSLIVDMIIRNRTES